MYEGNNIWNNSLEGSSWNNFTGKDADGNGIVDTPYVVNQKTESIDYLPTSIDNFSAIFTAIQRWQQ